MAKFTLVGALLFSGACAALPLNIFPKESLPKEVARTQSVKAFYTIQNNTAEVLVANFIQSLPPNVTQITNDTSIPNLCGKTFTLNPKNLSQDSCTLALSITGAVNGSDPDPEHHLFACLSDETTCAGTKFPLDVKVVPLLLPTFVGVGYYGGINFGEFFAGVAYSTDQGQTWQQKVLPRDNTTTAEYLYGTSCNGKHCVAVGQAVKTTYPRIRPNLAISDDAGKTWPIHKAVDLPYGESSWKGVYCSGNNCIAVGSAGDGFSEAFSLVSTSSDGGKNWQNKTLKPSAAPPIVEGLNAIDCVQNFCLAVGSNAFSGAIMATTKNKQDWTVTPFDPSLDKLLRVACSSDKRCIAVGRGNNSTALAPLKVVLVDTVTEKPTVKTLDIPKEIINDPNCANAIVFDSNLSSIVCPKSNFCVASGNYACIGSSSTQYSVFAFSTDEGETWTQSLTQGKAGLNGMSCLNNFCAGVGGTLSLGNLIMMTSRSVNNGQNWTPFQTLDYPNPPPAVRDSYFNGVSAATS